jgi:hypothetical protein
MRSEGAPYIYFIQASSGGNIKIGYSRSVASRLEALMSWSPERLIILATVPGGVKQEQAIHFRLKDYWSHHEWFRPCDAISSLVKFVIENGELPNDFKSLGVTRYVDMPHRKRRGPLSAESKAAISAGHQMRRDRLARGELA